jgi:hypothetical protein
LSTTRRDFLIGSAALSAGASVCLPFFLPKYHVDRRPKRSRVAVLHAGQYSQHPLPVWSLVPDNHRNLSAESASRGHRRVARETNPLLSSAVDVR